VKHRLFWKFLIGSWVTLALVALGNAVLFHAVATEVMPLSVQVAARYTDLELAAAAEILKAEGPSGLERFASRLPPDVHLELTRGDVGPAQSAPSPANGFKIVRSQLVPTAAGDFTITAASSHDVADVPPLLRRVPAGLLFVDFLALSLFSVIIAQYLAGPIRRLSTGLARAAEGDLDVRVTEKLGGRKDELADLARTFDYMADKLKQLVQSRERLLHDVSHEFRSPLTRIRLAAEFAVNNPGRWRSSIERIFNDVERLSRLVETLLTMSRVQFTAAKSETYFDLADLLCEVVADVRFEAQAANITLHALVPDQLRDRPELVLNGNPDLLRRAIENVLRNAVRFSKPEQTVTLVLSSPAEAPHTLQLEISDEGPGVPPEDLNRIFEPFERLEESSGSEGFGLGLAIARTAVQGYHGTIWAANRSTGGLIVTLRLPTSVRVLSSAPRRPTDPSR
jgi:two-component system OmpR family sensor kinase